MYHILYKNVANIIVLFRIGLVIIVLVLLSNMSFVCRVSGLFILLFAVFLDGFDGYIARRLKISSRVGGLVDTLGDRITENLIIMFFAYKQLIPFWIAVFFIVRSFIADFVRSLNFNKGIGTFHIHTSHIGHLLVSSTVSRFVYLFLKILLFTGGSVMLILEVGAWHITESHLTFLACCVLYNSFVLFAFSLVRFIVLLYDSKYVLKEHFMSDAQ